MKFFVPLFFWSLFGELLFLHLFPPFRLLGFLPFLLFALMRLRLPSALWASATAGFTIDLLTSGTPLGVFALNYSLTTLILFRNRKFISEDKPLIVASYATLFSILSTLILFCFIPFTPSPLTLATDLVCMPLADGLYTLLWVLSPLLLYNNFKPVIDRELSRITRR